MNTHIWHLVFSEGGGVSLTLAWYAYANGKTRSGSSGPPESTRLQGLAFIVVYDVRVCRCQKQDLVQESGSHSSPNSCIK